MTSMALRAKVVRDDTIPVDPLIAGPVLLLMIFGVVMVASASSEISARLYGSPFHLLFRHLIALGLGLGAAVSILLTPVKVWQKVDWLLLLMTFALLVAVLVPGIGREVNGSQRWISLGFFTIQGSEYAKIFVLIYTAGYLVRRKDELQQSISGFLKPLLLVSLIVLLLLEEPDFGAAVVIMSMVMGVIYLAGAPLRHFLPVITLCLLATTVLAVWKPYRLERLTTFADPWEHQFSSGYQLTQALIAFGRGEWLGLGLGNSIQKQFFLPEAHTDFLFSISAEELGVIGALTIIGVFCVLVSRAFWIGKCAYDKGEEFSAYLAYGIALLLGVQACVNIGVNLGLLPTKGLTLPFLSYGGNSLIVSCMLAALLLRVAAENGLKVKARG